MSSHRSRHATLVRGGVLLAVFATVMVLARPAQADIVVVTGVNNQGTDNVLLSSATDVLTAMGTVGPNNLIVNFTSSSGSGLVSANPSGQATVVGGTGNTVLMDLQFALANNETFTRAVFNINAATNGSALIHVDGVNINGGFFEDTFTVDANGQNFFTVTAINGQLMTAIDLRAISGATFQDIRQVRLGGFPTNSQDLTAVPEPGTMALLGSGLVAAVARRRRQRTV